MVSPNPEFRSLKPKHLLGLCLEMNLAQNKTFQLWNSFMPRRKEIVAALSTDLYSVQVYDASYSFKNFDPTAKFTKWATVEVPDFKLVPEGMEKLNFAGGLYAVFLHKGNSPQEAEKTFRYIFGTWLPASGYDLEQRPHFEVLGEKYNRDSPESEEEIFIPVKKIR